VEDTTNLIAEIIFRNIDIVLNVSLFLADTVNC